MTKKTTQPKSPKLPKPPPEAEATAGLEQDDDAMSEGEADTLGQPEAKGGRPTKYRAEFAKVAGKMCEMGATDMDLAEALGVSTRTIWRWLVQHPEFCRAAKLGKDEADQRVERAFYQRCIGYSHHAEKIMQNAGVVIRAGYIEHVPPDPGAALNWLANRQPDKWRKAPEGDGGNGTLTIQLVDHSGAPQKPPANMEKKHAPTLERMRTQQRGRVQ